MRICLVLEGCYPYVYGGVSAWMHQYIQKMKDHEFILWVIGADSSKQGQFVYEIPKNVVQVYEVFLNDALKIKEQKGRMLHRYSAEETETLAISTNIVISLGMVGALSIVRFRTAIKDPMDLLYLFWAISSGITSGAGMYILAFMAAAVMVVIFALVYYRREKGKVYIAVLHYTGDKTGDAIIQALGHMKFFIKSKTMRKERMEMAVELFLKKDDMTFMERIRALDGVEDITLIQYNGEYHG